MPKIVTLVGVNYEVQQAMYTDEEAYTRGDEPKAVNLRLADPSSGELCVVQFDALPWQNFKKHVESDGKVNAPTIVVAGAGQPPSGFGVPERGPRRR